MIGAPEFKEQPKGPFAWRKWFNQIVVFCNSLARMEIKGGGKVVYGENKVVIDLSGATNFPARIAILDINVGGTFTRYTNVPAETETII